MRFVPFFLFLLSLEVFSISAYAQCDSLYLGNDTTLCLGQSVILDAGDMFDTYLWNTGSADQTISITESGEYWCEVDMIDSTNLVINGEFSGGYFGFQSDYVIGTGGTWGLLSNEGTFAITINSNLVHTNFSNCTDHTTGDGSLMVVNGAAILGQNVWFEAIPVTPNTRYHFSGWLTSVHPENPAILDISFNGVTLEQVILTNVTCYWYNFFGVWDSGENSTAEFNIVNQNTVESGNDFAIDDVSLYKVCHLTDTILIEFEPEVLLDLGPDTVLCEGESLILDVDQTFVEYEWQDGSQQESFEVLLPGIYWLTVTNELGCTGVDTIEVGFTLLPEINLGNDTTICEGDSLILFATDSYEYYEWQDGSSGQTLIAKEAGLYWVVATLNGCTKRDSLYLSVDESTQPVNLGNDTTICLGDYVNIGTSPGIYLSYLWSTGDTTATILVNQVGTYTLEVFGACGSSLDEITISNWPYPNPELGDDLLFCFGQYDYITSAPGFLSYAWNNQAPSSDNEFLVSETNFYNVQVEDYHGCFGFDTIFVEIGKVVQLGEPSIDLCEGDSIVLDAGADFDFYHWNEISGTQTMAVYEGGVYKVEVGYLDNDECISEDQVTVHFFELPEAIITSGDYFCDGDTLHLNAPIGSYTYYWNNEISNSAQFIIESGGNYTLKLENVCGFDSTEKMIEQHVLPNVNLGEDQLLFPGESLSLDAGVFESYQWNDDPALNDQFYIVTSENVIDTSTIFVEVFDGLCYNKDGVFIEVFYVKVPAVITPNGDGENDIFKPFDEGWAGIHNHTISVFNRWGEKVWESNDFPSGWDGKRDGVFVTDGTYFWVLEIKYGPNNISKLYKGSLTILGTSGS